MTADEPNDDRTQSFIALTSGTSVLHYKIIDKIGAGGMGEVYLAEDTKLNRKVALKFLPHHLCQDEDCRKRFTREAQAAAGLDHPNIAGIYEVGEYQNRPFYSMQLVEGQSLREVIRGKDLPIERILEIAIQVCEGLKAAHEKGIIHRDIKPSNILIDTHGRVRIVDFGLAAIRGSEHLTKTGSTLGTIGYMSPEQVQGKEVDHRSDVFSLGVVLYELITRHHPFKRDTEAATLKAVSDIDPEPLARFKSNLPEFLESIMSKLLEKDPDHRYQTAAGAVSDLLRAKRDLGSKSPSSSARMTSKRSLRLIVPLLIVLITAAILILKPWKIEISPTQEALAEENKLAVMYFDNMADPSDSLRLGEIVTSLLITDLTESEFVKVVSSQRLYDILKQMGLEGKRNIDRTTATEIAKTARAKWMLVGNIINLEPEIIITAQLIDVTTGNASASQRIEGAAGERVFPLVDRLTVEVKRDLTLPSEADLEADPDVAEMTTHSSEAFRYYLEGQELFYRHHWADAEKEFLKAIEIDSTFSMAHYYLAAMDYWLNDTEAKIHIEHALNYIDRVSHHQRYYINELNARINRDIPRAIANLEKIIERYPDDKDAYVSLGLIKKFETLELEDALRNFKKATELDPLNREALNQLAYIYNDLGQFEKAVWAINKYIEVAPDEANPYDSKGEIMAMNGKLDEAIASYEKAMKLKPDYGRARLANLYLFRGDTAKADSLYHAIASDPDEKTRAYGRMALTLKPRYQGRFQDALRLLEIGIETDRMELGTCPEIANKLMTRVLINDFLGDDQAVIENLNRAISIMSENETRRLYSSFFRAYLCAKLAETGDHSGSDSLLSEITALITEPGYPDSSFYWIASGYKALKLNHYDTAAIYWEKTIRGSPHNFPTLQLLGESYLYAGQLGSAVSTLENAIKIYDGSRTGEAGLGVLSHYLLGRAYEASGWTDRAITQYERFLELWKDADPGIKEMGDARQRLTQLKGSS
jgi:serine/threonine protein kinase/tetratricopeptide (TPR) repeat protein